LDTLGLFSEDPEEKLEAALWLYGSSQGVVHLGEFSSLEEAQSALKAFSSLDLTFLGAPEVSSRDSLANLLYKKRQSVAVLLRGGQVQDHALLVKGWVPQDDMLYHMAQAEREAEERHEAELKNHWAARRRVRE